jgi:hypothetical protein
VYKGSFSPTYLSAFFISFYIYLFLLHTLIIKSEGFIVIFPYTNIFWLYYPFHSFLLPLLLTSLFNFLINFIWASYDLWTHTYGVLQSYFPVFFLSFCPPASCWLPLPSKLPFMFMSFFFYRYRVLIWEKRWNTCLSESDLFHLTYWSLIYPFSCKWQNLIFLYTRIILPCVDTHFLHPFICWWARRLIP